MLTSTRRPAARRRLTSLLALALAVLLTGALVPTAAAHEDGARGSGKGSSSQAATVMTRNLYLGADLAPVITALATAPQQVPGAATETWNAVQATDPPERMAAIAEEIVEHRPAVVGLQEVTRWVTYDDFPPVDAGTVAYDFLDLLLEALADRGVVYREVRGATAENFGSPPIPVLPGATGVAAVSMSDRDVILRRADVRVRNTRSGTFANILRFPLAGGGELPVLRGWGSVDVMLLGERRGHRSGKPAVFRFVNSHLEAFGLPGVDAEALRLLQVRELLAAHQQIAPRNLPKVYVGDYNTRAPGAPAYAELLAGVGIDAWTAANPRDPGLTCCFDAAVNDPDAMLTSRIDLVLVTPGIRVKDAEVVGEEVDDLTESGLWPSDHAGVVADPGIPAVNARGRGHKKGHRR